MGHTPNERQKYIDELRAYGKERRARESGHQRPKQADAEKVTDLSPEHVDEKAQGQLKTPKCEYHPEVDAVGVCSRCQRFICAECQVTWEGKVYCKNCYDELQRLEGKSEMRIKDKAVATNKTFGSLLPSRRTGILILVGIVLIASVAAILVGHDDTPRSAADQVTVDVPSLSEKEACALVYNYLQSRIDEMAVRAGYYSQKTLNRAAPHFYASYVGKGRWRVQALGYGYNTQERAWFYYPVDGQWYVYESSQIVEPSNTKARNLLQDWQKYRE